MIALESPGASFEDLQTVSFSAFHQLLAARRILEGMDWLYQGAKPGDLLVFHYSGYLTERVDWSDTGG